MLDVNVQFDVAAQGGGRVLSISRDRDDRRIFWVCNF